MEGIFNTSQFQPPALQGHLPLDQAAPSPSSLALSTCRDEDVVIDSPKVPVLCQNIVVQGL